jgi:hypothetical protein
MTNYIKLIFDIDSNKWLDAMKSEMNFIYINQL